MQNDAKKQLLTNSDNSETEKETKSQTIENEAKKENKQQEIEQEFYCDAMNERTINKIVDGARVDVVVIIGFPGYGKTTFLSSLYYEFIKNIDFCDHIMYDSDTYSGLERRLFIRTLKTDIDEDNKRTIKGEDSLLSLSLIENKTNKKRKLVFSDRSGEDYMEYIGTPDEIAKNEILKTADHLVFFIDIEKLLNSDGLIRYHYGLLLQVMSDQKIISNKSRIELVFNKIDMIKESSEEFNNKVGGIKSLFTKELNDKMIHEYYIDSTGISDNFESVKKLCVDLLNQADKSSKEIEANVDWVNLSLKEVCYE